MAGFRFRAGLWPTLAAAVGIALALALGDWQLSRGHEKAALQQKLKSADREPLIAMPAAEISAGDVAWRRVEARGRFEPKYAVFIDNRVLHGAVGYHVVMPLELGDSGRYVLVNRGWVAGTGSRSVLPRITTPPQVVTVVGLATAPGGRYLELSTRVAEGNVWQNLTLERYRKAVPIAIQPVVIQQENDLGDGLRRDWAPPDVGTNTHYGYAFQWFTLAAAILIFYVVAHVRKRTPRAD